MKTAIIILSDPKSGSDEALGRVFNALAFALECRKHNDDVVVEFIGTGTRWPGVLNDPSHPVHGLFKEVRNVIRGASCGCAEFFGATESLQACEIPVVREHSLAGGPDLASFRRLVADGYQVVTF